ncbi:MAG: M55 family metallopeptidase [Rubrobacter sp.]|nr:M55 family metallopeptidase [Rubrobacter sp.]
MKVFISADMEGVTGVTHPQDTQSTYAGGISPANTVIHDEQFSSVLTQELRVTL